MTARDAYQYFVLKAQEIAVSKNWSPGGNLQYVSIKAPSKNHCAQLVVAKGFRCIYSNQGVWYLDHLDVPWDEVYTAEPLEGIQKASEQELVIGGEVCMWAETVDTSDVQQTIWPRAAAAAVSFDWQMLAAELDYAKLITPYLPQNAYGVREILPQKMLPCLLNKRGVPAAPVKNFYARKAPVGPGSCYEQ
ncbi:hypothetical protein V8G54_020239 [Vigna mungo]|uniref:beta-N-acetylhexosaminidase n=1 Tax=Vigna mungo TaxID=3915 RepID=A0AAQ3NF45_VIGMU